MNTAGVIRRIALAFMVLGLAVAMVGCQGAVGAAGDDGSSGAAGQPGQQGDPESKGHRASARWWQSKISGRYG